jgi:uncharacterized protein (TIGR03435 family)
MSGSDGFSRRVYRVIVRLHPAEFRGEFGREMWLDFDDALASRGFASLLVDGMVSLGRQWAGCIAGSGDEAGESVARHSLLAGQYGMICDEPMNAKELGRGLVASVTLLAVCGLGMRFSPVRMTNVEVVHAASGDSEPDQVGSSSVPGGGNPGAQGARAGGREVGRGDGRLQFDVATVRQAGAEVPSASSAGLGMDDGGAPTGGYFSATQTLAFYILFAYDMPKFRFGVIQKQLPEWAQTERFTIQARADGNPTTDQMRMMLRSLLEDRFGLVAGTKKREVAAYSLAFAQAGRMGARLRSHGSLPECHVPAAGERYPGTVPTTPGGFPVECGRVVQLKENMPGEMRYGGREVTMGQIAGLANDMSDWRQLDRPVVDGTKVAGTFDFDVEFMPPAGSGLKGRGSSDEMGVPLQEALREQLGLKLQPVTAPVEAFVITHVQKPGEN